VFDILRLFLEFLPEVVRRVDYRRLLAHVRVGLAFCLANFSQVVRILEELMNTAIPTNTTVMATNWAVLRCSLKNRYDVSMPASGTISESGATADAGYFFIRLFHVL